MNLIKTLQESLNKNEKGRFAKCCFFSSRNVYSEDLKFMKAAMLNAHTLVLVVSLF